MNIKLHVVTDAKERLIALFMTAESYGFDIEILQDEASTPSWKLPPVARHSLQH